MLRVESEYVFVCILCVLCVNVWGSNRVRVYVCNPAQGKQGETGKKSPLCPLPPPSPSGARRCPKLPGVQGADLVILLDSQGPHPCDSKLLWAPASPLLAWSCLGKPRDLSEGFAGAAEVVQV